MAAPALINCIFIGDLISVQTVPGSAGDAENLQLSWGWMDVCVCVCVCE